MGRKEAGLSPTDEVTVYYDIQPAGHDLVRIISDHQEYIETTTKNPIRKGAKMILSVAKGFCGGKTIKTYGEPKVKFVNVVHGDQVGTVLLENPVGANGLSIGQLMDEVQGLFGFQSKQLFKDPEGKQEVRDVLGLNGKTIYTSKSSDISVSGSGCCCPWVDVVGGGGSKTGTLLLENPSGVALTQYSAQAIGNILGLKSSSNQVKVVNSRKENVVLAKVNPSVCSGQTLTVA